jgi:hypothetical protein
MMPQRCGVLQQQVARLKACKLLGIVGIDKARTRPLVQVRR